jgi:hypothetical protein
MGVVCSVSLISVFGIFGIHNIRSDNWACSQPVSPCTVNSRFVGHVLIENPRFVSV